MSKSKGSTYKAPSAEDYLMELLTAQRNAAITRQKTASQKVFEKLGETTDVEYMGKMVYSLNSDLVLRQGIDASELRHLKFLHAEKLKYFNLMNATNEKSKLREYAHEIECIEFEMQKAWHFTEDRNFHEWYKVPKCTCPRMDNADNRGTNRRIIVMDCPVHGE